MSNILPHEIVEIARRALPDPAEDNISLSNMAAALLIVRHTPTGIKGVHRALYPGSVSRNTKDVDVALGRAVRMLIQDHEFRCAVERIERQIDVIHERRTAKRGVAA